MHGLRADRPGYSTPLPPSAFFYVSRGLRVLNAFRKSWSVRQTWPFTSHWPSLRIRPSNQSHLSRFSLMRSAASLAHWRSRTCVSRRSTIALAISSGLGKNLAPGVIRYSARAARTSLSEYRSANCSKSHRYPSIESLRSCAGYLSAICASNTPSSTASASGKRLCNGALIGANAFVSDARSTCSIVTSC